MFSSSTTMLLFSLHCLFHLATATGHLRLELTSSMDFTLNLKTDSSFQSILLSMGTTRIVSFHPKVNQENLEVVFFKTGSDPATQIYQMRKIREPSYETFVFSDAVLLVQSFFECDAGFYGDHCLDRTTSTSVTNAVFTTTTSAPMVTNAPTTQSMLSISTNAFICGSLILVIAILILVNVAIRSRQQHIYIGSEFAAPPKNCKMNFEDYECQSPESVRYTAAPFRSVTISL